MKAKELALKNRILECYSGSHAYGTNLPTSDVDIRGLFVAEPINVITPFFKIEQFQDFPGEDKVLYEVSKFMKLLIDMNPNILELLWVDDSDIIMRDSAYDFLRSHRDDLLSSKAKFTFSGYAFSQMKRIKGHNKWINNPVEDKPRQVDFLKCVHALTENGNKSEFSKFVDQSGFRLLTLEGNTLGLYQVGGDYRAFTADDGSLNLQNDDNDKAIKESGDPMFIVKYNKEDYKHRMDQYTEYQKWKKNRNKDRSALEMAHGYDTKHAMHLLRLYRMGIEILEEGVVKVKRPDAKELLEIRNGALTYDELKV